MPVYEYICTSCEYNWEINQGVNDEKLTKCPECEKESAKRLISAGSFQLKGQGWYKTGGY